MIPATDLRDSPDVQTEQVCPESPAPERSTIVNGGWNDAWKTSIAHPFPNTPMQSRVWFDDLREKSGKRSGKPSIIGEYVCEFCGKTYAVVQGLTTESGNCILSEVPKVKDDELALAEYVKKFESLCRRPEQCEPQIVHCSVVGCDSQMDVFEAVNSDATYLCRAHSFEDACEWVGCDTGDKRNPPPPPKPRPLHIDTPSTSHLLRAMGFTDSSPEPRGDYAVAVVAHTRRLDAKIAGLPYEPRNDDLQFYQCEEGLRTGRYFNENPEKLQHVFTRQQNHKHKDEAPEALQSYVGRNHITRERIYHKNGSSIVFDFIDDIEPAGLPFGPFREDSFEGRALLYGTSSGGYARGRSMIPARESADERENTLETLTETKQDTDRPIVATLNKHWYRRAERGELRFNTPGENLVELRDKKGLKASVLVNLHHPQTMKALAVYYEVLGGPSPYEGMTPKKETAMKKQAARELKKMQHEELDFTDWKLDDLLQVWRERKPVAITTSGREVRVFPLDIINEYSGLAVGLGGDRALLIENAAQQVIDAEFSRRQDRAIHDARGEDAKHAALVKTVREDNAARIFTIDFGGRAATPETAPDELWHLAHAVLQHDVPVDKYPEIKEMIAFYPDLLES